MFTNILYTKRGCFVKWTRGENPGEIAVIFGGLEQKILTLQAYTYSGNGAE